MTELNAIAKSQNWSEVYNLAENYQQQQQWQKAAVAFGRAIQLRPDFFWSYHHLGDILIQLQQWQKAAEAYSHAVKIDPNFFWSWHNLGDVYTHLKQWNKAKVAYSHAVKIDPNFFWSWHNLGDVYTHLQQWDKAIAIYLQAILLQPKHRLTYQKLGTTFKQRGSLEESIQYYRRLIQSSNHNSIFNSFSNQPQSLLKIADQLAVEHQTDAAISLYYMVLEIKPSKASVLVKLSRLLQQQNQLQRDLISNQEALHSEFLTRQKANIPTKPTANKIPGQIVIKTNFSIPPDQLEELCAAVGWSSRPLDRVQQALNNSLTYITAWHIHNEQQRLVGFARAISDAAFHAVLLDILVHPDFQNQGIGKTIVQALIKQLKEAKIQDITLFASPHIVDFYHKLGFVSQPNNLQWMLLSDRSTS